MAKKRKRSTSKKTDGGSTVAVSRRICNIVPSQETENDWSFQDAAAAGALGAVTAPPPSVDLRAAWWKINDQEDTGSCVGWATADGDSPAHVWSEPDSP